MLVYQSGSFEDGLSLSKDAIKHVKARRMKVGDSITLCDGEGLVAQAELVEISRNQVLCKAYENQQHKPNNYPRLVLGITKLPTLEFILQKATEIGVSEIILLKCEYTPIAFDQGVFDKKQDRWERIIVSACEQSEMYFKPKLSWMSFSDYIKTDQAKCMFHPYAESTEVSKDADLMIGPEGGWSEAELKSNIQSAKINTGILRADTACMAVLLASRITD